jgi:peptide/nickel transport system permease protein
VDVSAASAVGEATPAPPAAPAAPRLGPLARERGPLADLVVRLFRDKPLGAAGAVIFLLFLCCGVFAGVLAPHGINDIDLVHRFAPPSLDFPLGTDRLGRDMLSRLLYGARISMIVGFLGAALATAISVAVGVVSGYLGGRVDMVTQRAVDAWMAFPDLVLLIVVVAVVGAGMPQIIVILGLLYGIGGSRIVRGAVVAAREHMYVHAAQSLGARTPRILWRHILPNVMPVILVLFTTRIGAVILSEAGLSFLGLGIPPPAPTWGSMLSGSARTYMYIGPWLALAPGLCITLVVYSVNVLGDALRDLLDPRMRGMR